MKTAKNEILNELMLSREYGNVVGIRIKNKLLLTVVEEITEDHEVVIKSLTLYGQRLLSDRIQLSEIEGVLKFNTRYEDPLYVRLREIKKSIREMRGKRYRSFT